MLKIICNSRSFRKLPVPMQSLLCFFLLILFLCLEREAVAAVIGRTQPAVGSIVGATGDAQIRCVETRDWLTAEIEQDLLTGDGLRTGTVGTMALLFADRTQVRVQRNSILTVKAVAGSTGGGSTRLRLDRGGTWSRAVTGSQGVEIETPSATAAIRGTDWSLTVDDQGSTRLIVLDGEVVLENPYGRVTVMRGEIAFAEIGRAPTKTILVNPRDREQQVYNLSLIEALETFFKLTDLKVNERRQAKELIEAIAPAQRNTEQWLGLAELSCDLGDWQVTRRALAELKTADAQMKARAELVAGFLAFLDYDFPQAEQLFAAAESARDPDRILTARIGRTAALLKLRRSSEAESLLNRMEKEYREEARYLLFRLILTAFSGDMPAAVDQARQLARNFPDNPDFPAAEGVMAILLARPEEAKDAAHQALALDPGLSVAYEIIGEYKDTYLGNSEGAVASLRQGLSYNDRNSSLWGSLGHVYDAMGEYRLAEEAFLRSLELNPKNVTALANYSILLLDQERTAEAQQHLERMEQIDPGRDFTMIIAGRLALQGDNITGAKQSLLKATTLNPAYSDSALILGQTYYQENELAQARQALENGSRMDPNDPLIPLVASVIATDRAYADEAIEYAREAMRLYRQRGGEGVTGLASTRGGNNTLGAAFANLGLDSWADYYNELSFDPYSAESHFYRAAHDSEKFSSLFLGLLLEPLATSSRNRFVDFYRRPFTDSEINGSVGWPGNGTSYRGEGTIQGFTRTPKPMSYYLTANYGHSPEDRDHTDKMGSGFVGGIGVNITPYDRLFFDVEGAFTTTELPGTLTLPDPDDELDSRMVSTGLGYSHSFGARNILLGRIMAQNAKSTVSNDDPLGLTLSDLEYSLVNYFGPEVSRFLYEWGLRDDTDPADPNSPTLTAGGSGPYLSGAFLDGLDTKPYARLRIENRIFNVNVRHLLALRSVDLTYGIEFQTLRQKMRSESIEFVQRDPGTGLIQGPAGSAPFPFGDPVWRSEDDVMHGIMGSAYIDALWRIRNNLWLAGSVFADHADDENRPPVNRLDPRVGFAWQASASDWLRLAFREDVQSSGLYSLSPVATVGLLPQTAYLDDDGRVASCIARWDREWTAHFFTALELRRQDINDFRISVPDSLMYYYADEGRIDQAGLSANLWLRGGFGVFARALWRDTENRSGGTYNGEKLALIPERELDAGITWIHPLQIRLNLVLHFVDERAADTANSIMLGGYETVDFTASWQPLDKRLELGLTVTNLLDREYEIGQDMPANGRNVLLTVAWRF